MYIDVIYILQLHIPSEFEYLRFQHEVGLCWLI